jgi:hypothetical protein
LFDKTLEIVSSLTLCWEILFLSKFQTVKNFFERCQESLFEEKLFSKAMSLALLGEKAKTTIDISFNASNKNLKIVAKI